jgi:hypothetical protein
MRHRRSSGPSDSLDLLLDTICNTFGGVLFLSLLIVLMIRPISQSNAEADASAPSPETLDEMSLDVESLRAEVGALRTTLKIQQSVLDATDATAVASRAEELKRLQEQQQRAVEESDRMLAETAKAIAEARANEAKLAAIDGQLQEKRQEVERAREELEQARRSDPAAPRQGGGELRSTNKRNITLILSYDRVYVWHRYDAYGNRIGLNTDEFVQVERDEDGIRTQPKRTVGIPIKAADAAGAMRRRLAAFPANAFYLEVILHSDTFDTFQDFKRIAIDLNYEYMILLKDDSLPVMDQGGNDKRVQ